MDKRQQSQVALGGFRLNIRGAFLCKAGWTWEQTAQGSGGIPVPGIVQKIADAFHSLGTWFMDVLGSVRLMARLDDPGTLFKPESVYDCVCF